MKKRATPKKSPTALARELSALRKGFDRNTEVVNKFLTIFERVLREKDALVKAAMGKAR